MTTEANAVELKQTLDVAKQLLKEQDKKLSKYESIDIDATLGKLAKYESIGEPDQLTVKPETEDNTMSGNEKTETLSAEDAELLARYKELGTIEELEELADRLEESEVISKDEAEQIEETKEKLESYQRFGTLAQLQAVADEFEEMKMKAESARLADQFGIEPETAASILAKTESVAQAESILSDLAPKHESNQGRRNSHVESQLQRKHESATIVGKQLDARQAKLKETLKRI